MTLLNTKISPQDFKEMAEYIDESFPGLQSMFMPRRFEACGPYAGTREIGQRMAMAAICSGLPGGAVDEPTDLTTATALRLSEFTVPTYFVAPHFFRAAMMSRTPELTWGDVRWPIDAMLFMLPKGVLNSPDDGGVVAIAVARHSKGPMQVRVHQALDPYARVFADDRVTYIAFTENLATFAGHCPLSTPISEVASGALVGMIDIDGDGHPVLATLSNDESSFLANIGSLCARLMMITAVRSDLVKEQTLKRPATLGPKPRSELWSPNIIGANYRMPHDSSGAENGRTGRSPRFHIRLGHLRNQRHGPGNSLVSLIWIEPTLVAAETVSESPEA